MHPLKSVVFTPPVCVTMCYHGESSGLSPLITLFGGDRVVGQGQADGVRVIVLSSEYSCRQND